MPHAKLSFDRLCTLLEYGATPVVVLEGKAPEAKFATLQKRYGGVGTGIWLKRAGHDIREVAEAMGVTVVQAPGEAEAACAALAAGGTVDAVLTNDSDALCFGATCVWKELRLDHRGVLAKCSLVECTLDRVDEMCGFSREGIALMAALSGGDYNIGGIQGLGVDSAAEIARTVCEWAHGQDLERRMETAGGDLVALIETAVARAPDTSILSITHCTSCRTCGHGTTGKALHGAHGCEECGTHPVSRGGNGAGGCIPMPEGSTCPCPFHSRAGERMLAKAAQRMKQSPEALKRMKEAHDIWRGQGSAEAVAGLLPTRPRWLGPDLEELERTLGTQFRWKQAAVRRKLLPLVIEHSLRMAVWQKTAGPSERRGRCPTLFVPLRIQKVQGRTAAQQWRYVVEWKGLHAASQRQTPCSDGDLTWEEIMDAADAPSRCARMSLMKKAYPHLVETFEEVHWHQQVAASNKGRKKQSLAEAAKESKRITDFFRGRSGARPDPTTGAASPAVSESSSGHVVIVSESDSEVEDAMGACGGAQGASARGKGASDSTRTRAVGKRMHTRSNAMERANPTAAGMAAANLRAITDGAADGGTGVDDAQVRMSTEGTGTEMLGAGALSTPHLAPAKGGVLDTPGSAGSDGSAHSASSTDTAELLLFGRLTPVRLRSPPAQERAENANTGARDARAGAGGAGLLSTPGAFPSAAQARGCVGHETGASDDVRSVEPPSPTSETCQDHSQDDAARDGSAVGAPVRSPARKTPPARPDDGSSPAKLARRAAAGAGSSARKALSLDEAGGSAVAAHGDEPVGETPRLDRKECGKAALVDLTESPIDLTGASPLD